MVLAGKGCSSMSKAEPHAHCEVKPIVPGKLIPIARKLYEAFVSLLVPSQGCRT